jgi:hypothetical protein
MRSFRSKLWSLLCASRWRTCAPSNNALESGVESAELRKTVLALREELERQEAENRSSVQRATAQAADEIAQLKATVVALRQELERQRNQQALELQESRVSANQEQTQLRNTIVRLREELEKLNEPA